MADEQDTVQVRFLADTIYENEGRGRGKRFKADTVYEMPQEHAQRWIRRNAAELVDPPEEKFPEVAKPRRGRPPKDRSADDDGDSQTEQAQRLAESGPGPLKPQHTVPHPSQAEPGELKAKEQHDLASASKSEPKTDMTDSNKNQPAKPGNVTKPDDAKVR